MGLLLEGRKIFFSWGSMAGFRWDGKADNTGTSLFGLDGRDVCHVGGGGGCVVDGSFELVCLSIDHNGYN